jgi:hypothetical protein
MSTILKLDLCGVRFAAIQRKAVEALGHRIGGFLVATSGPLRLERVVTDLDGKEVQALYLRERNWFEYFDEKLFASAGRIARIEAEVRNEIDSAFSQLIHCIESDPAREELPRKLRSLEIREHKEALISRTSNGSEQPSQAQEKSRFGVSVSIDSPLDRPCNFAILGAAYFGSDADEGIAERRPAKQAFDAAWLAREPGELPAYRKDSGKGRIEFESCRLRPKGNALDHIATIRSIPDDPILRSRFNHVATLSRPVWKDFYRRCLEGLHGTGVMQPYPDGWERDASGGVAPIYSVKNLRGMVDAAIERTSAELAQANGKPPLSLRFAAQDKEIHDFLRLEILGRRPGVRVVDDDEIAVPPPGQASDIDDMSALSQEGTYTDFKDDELPNLKLALAYAGGDSDIES